jgi:hypothetical protein
MYRIDARKNISWNRKLLGVKHNLNNDSNTSYN